MKKLEKHKKRLLMSFIFLAALSFGLYVYTLNQDARQMEKYNEITFIGANRAVVFWKTKEDSLGYVRYGSSKFKRDKIETQTSSEPGEIHAVFLENIPLEGIYVSIHNDSDNFLILPRIFKITYEINDLIDEE